MHYNNYCYSFYYYYKLLLYFTGLSLAYSIAYINQSEDMIHLQVMLFKHWGCAGKDFPAKLLKHWENVTVSVNREAVPYIINQHLQKKKNPRRRSAYILKF